MRKLGIAILFALTVQTVSAADDVAAARKLYVTKCARCHEFYDPTKYDDAKWSEWMSKMKRKARLNDDQYNKLDSYLQSVRASK